MAIQKRTVGVIGTGNVGVAAAYALFMQQTASDLILLDKDQRRAEGEALDLMHGQTFAGPTRVRVGDYADLAEAQVIVIAAGVGQRPGETRLDLMERNVAVFRAILTELDRHAPTALLVIATNPVDVLTYVAQELSTRPPQRILGTGTMLDTARFRSLLGEHYGVDPRSVHAYILGEHGDTEFPVWSDARIGGLRLVGNTINGRPYDRPALDAIFERTRRSAYDIIERKGYTNLAIGLVIARLVQTILDGQHSVLPVSVRLQGEYGISGVCLSLPGIVSENGLETSILPELDDTELAAMHHSANVLRERIAEALPGQVGQELKTQEAG
ncbi:MULTISPECIES: L-lactate dehydrogenase [Chloracidobacterium]|jgi:L-lactate dehydrogenase|uniref:L-lactate dehydrogenase n=1 Tax=Chloracidobacterium thermophilum (strain B) TaxID=981222 RepID=G2LE08_CHLTF|nr:MULTISPECIES: L-lactate dehydrogenase [Chloracidobacterium]AEP11070.1 malate dehydrogenase (NAD) [Chloracidobacterium thermophilum B]QUV78988.1 L-lactate dehydrogenase [Chloracidobacterium thermophilum]QUV82031.1 L-lactate dehydrogenase [Chloracidobacterium sp. D]